LTSGWWSSTTSLVLSFPLVRGCWESRIACRSSASGTRILITLLRIIGQYLALGLRTPSCCPNGAEQDSPGQRPRCYPQVSPHRYAPRGRMYPRPKLSRASVGDRSKRSAHLVRCASVPRIHRDLPQDGPFPRTAAPFGAVVYDNSATAELTLRASTFIRRSSRPQNAISTHPPYEG
jgi:hypothetical protein